MREPNPFRVHDNGRNYLDVIFNTTVGHTVSQVILDMEPAVTNRCRWDILYDVVSAARYAAKKTDIMNSANVPYQTLVEYLNHATEKWITRGGNNR